MNLHATPRIHKFAYEDTMYPGGVSGEPGHSAVTSIALGNFKFNG